MLVNDTLEFEMCQNKSCIAVDIIDDMETYDKPETFPLIFTRSTEDVGSWLDNIKLSPTTITVTILDTIDSKQHTESQYSYVTMVLILCE